MDSLEGLAKTLYAAFMHGQYAALACGLLILAVLAARKYLGAKLPFLKTDSGGVLLAFVSGGLGVLFNALLGGTAFSWALVAMAAKLSFSAMGGYAGLKKGILPLLAWLLNKFGAGKLVSWMGLGKTPEQAEADAKEAGDEAVKANPASGAEGITGTPEDVN